MVESTETSPIFNGVINDAVEGIKNGSFGAEQYAALSQRERYELMQALGNVDPSLVDAVIDGMENAYERGE